MPTTDTIPHPRTTDTPCLKCGGDRTRRDYTMATRCHIPAEEGKS